MDASVHRQGALTSWRPSKTPSRPRYALNLVVVSTARHLTTQDRGAQYLDGLVILTISGSGNG